MTYYHIVYDLETQWRNLRDAMRANETGKWLLPTIPLQTMPDEDNQTQRICVAETIEDCITSIRVYGPFKRCLAANEDAKSYREVLNEAYPIIVLAIESDEKAITPTPEQVPDVKLTNERWFTKPVQITSSELKWLSSDSILFEDIPSTGDENWYFGKCTRVTFLESTDGYDHPWLNGKGHIMKSNLMDTEYEPYPDIDVALPKEPFYSVRIRDNLRLTIPDEIVKKSRYKAGRIVNIATSNLADEFGGDIFWAGMVDERNQIAIPAHIAKTMGLRDGIFVTVWETSHAQLNMSHRLEWTDTTNQPGDIISEIHVDDLSIHLVKKVHPNTTFYTVSLINDPGNKFNTQYRHVVYHHETGEEEPALCVIQHKATQVLYQMFAEEKLNLQELVKTNEYVGSRLKSLLML